MQGFYRITSLLLTFIFCATTYTRTLPNYSKTIQFFYTGEFHQRLVG